MRRDSSELSITDHTILGIVWRDGPCTTYAVMTEMAASPSTFYRNRASTTYRVVQRLENQGLVLASGHEAGSRGERQISVTEAGLIALRSWLRPPLPRVEVDHTVDLIRIRFCFLRALEVTERDDLIADALSALRVRMEQHVALLANSADPFDALPTLGGLYETEARIRWLEEVRARLSASL